MATNQITPDQHRHHEHWLASDLVDRKEGHNATKLFKDTLEQADKNPDRMITDGLNSYRVAGEEGLPLTEHVHKIHITGHKKGKDNNRVERLNGSIRDREKTYCGLLVNYNHPSTGRLAGLRARKPAYSSRGLTNGGR